VSSSSLPSLVTTGLMMMSKYNLEHEKEADWFAGAILLPRDALLEALARGMTPHSGGAFWRKLALLLE
jgi:hypothetical protein